MLKNKILIKITGSIAAYKTAYLISKLVQNGFEVKTVVTNSALNFIGTATLEGLTGNKVYKDSFEEGEMMSHINLTKWADLTILVPADANTINKFANGIADNLVTSLFLAHDQNKPYLIAPAMNTNMLNHPAIQASLEKLKKWGMIILPTENGQLACGDVGNGKMLDPEKIYRQIIRNLNKHTSRQKILITYGGTSENIDHVRYVTNMSTGNTGKIIADYLYLQGHDVTVIKSESSNIPECDVNIIEFSDFKSLEKILQNELSKTHFDSMIHLAAISDYSPIKLTTQENNIDLPTNKKIKSTSNTINIEFRKNPKLINKIKDWSLNKSLKLVGFKLLSNNLQDVEGIIDSLFKGSNADYIVYNSLSGRNGNIQNDFKIFDKSKNSIKIKTATKLAGQLEKILTE